jgi:hypothetical protein
LRTNVVVARTRAYTRKVPRAGTVDSDNVTALCLEPAMKSSRRHNARCLAIPSPVATSVRALAIVTRGIAVTIVLVRIYVTGGIFAARGKFYAPRS